jgi:phospholipid/cholesterol/gamma-HCH transport system substrate-binding protein
MTLGRIAGVVALLVAVVVVGYVIFGGSSGTHYTLMFQSASQLVKDDDVQIGGRRVGSVESIKLTNNNQAAIGIDLDDDYAPLRQGTTAIVRLTSLSGVANRYIALTPGPSNAAAIPAGATLPAEDTTSAVDLDQIFDMLDPKTRKGLSDLIRGFGTQYAGKGPQANAALKYFAPSLSTTSAVASALTADQKTFTDFVVNTSGLVSALATRQSQITDLVTNANTTAHSIAVQNQALSVALGALPQTLRQGSTTFVNLRSTLVDLTKLVDASKPASKNLAPFLADLRPLLVDANPVVKKLNQTLVQPGADNDTLDLLRNSVGLDNATSTAVPNGIKALEKVTPVLKFLRPYGPELVGWFRDFGASAGNYDADGHYARVMGVFDNFKSTGNVLTTQPNADRGQGYENAVVKRCPGAATQFPADGSAPFRDTDGKLDCDPSLAVPGP